MKISNKTPNTLTKPETSAKSSKAGKADSLDVLDISSGKPTGKAGALGSSRVDVSPRAQELAKAKELATPKDDIDEAKVARLQKMIDEGKYKVDADAIADRLLDEHSKMP